MRYFLALLSLSLAPVALARGQGKSFPQSMDFGPCLTTTLQSDGADGDTLKALVVRLGDAGTVAFDTETLRMSSVWTDGWLRLRGTAYDGSHGPMPSRRGQELVSVNPGPGWAFRGDFADPRAIPCGPLEKARAAYQGYWMHGDRVVIGYHVDGMAVRETQRLVGEGAGRAMLRTLELGPSDREQLMVVADVPDGVGGSSLTPLQTASGADPSVWTVAWQVPAKAPVEVDVSTGGWELLAMGGPSAADYLDSSSGQGGVVRFVPGFARPHGAPRLEDGAVDDAAGTALPRLHDGAAAQNDDDLERSVWFDKRDNVDDGRFLVDLQKVVEVSRVSSFTWHHGERAAQDYELFGSDAAAAPAPGAADPAAAGWVRLAHVRTESLGRGDKHGASVWREGGLGRFRHLLFVVRSGGAFFSEIDVFAGGVKAPVDRAPRPAAGVLAGLIGSGAALMERGGRLLLQVPPHAGDLRVGLLLASAAGEAGSFMAHLARSEPEDLAPLMEPGERRWGAPIVTAGQLGQDDGPYAVDTISIPFDNRFGSRMRTCAFDFFDDGRAAITTWNGDVWIVDGIDDDLAELRWTRFATGLYDPLGLRIVDDTVYVHGRDGISRLHDLNLDGEADYYECFNHDVMITASFHEFAFDLQTDAAGNFYCSKGAPVKPGGRGFTEIAPHHGTILRISKDGQRLDVMATGMRAPNGIGVSPDGVITSGDNEGTWMPRCRLNWITGPGYYAGVQDTAHRTPVPALPDPPLCWMPMEIDNSSGGQVWVTSGDWGPLAGRLLHLSYGTCGLYLVLKEEVDGVVQGGVVRFPVSFSSSAMRARFHPVDHQLYLAGFQGWQTSAAREGGFHRIRFTGRPLRMPVELRTCERGIYLTFDTPLDPELAQDPTSYGVEMWNYVYSENYGSPEVSPLDPDRKVERGKPNRDPLVVRAAVLSGDGRTVFLEVPAIRPVHQMKITYNLDSADGERVKGEVHNTIHALAADPGMPR